MQTRVFFSLTEIPEAQWNALSPANFPFSDHAYLLALETSGSVGREAGWQPIYLTVWSGERLVGALFCYLKDNSYGEYIFDWGWVRAYHESGIPYYPKLVAAVPFTPATGPKMLVHPGSEAEPIRALLIDSALELADKFKASSVHFLFTSPEESGAFLEKGFLWRHSYQFHWVNQGYLTFEDFLSSLKPRKRKQIAREREQLRQSGVRLEIVQGDQLTVEHARRFYRFYLATIEKMGAIAYLTPDFFERVFKQMPESIVLCLAGREGRWIAGAINYRRGDSLYGRYWGCVEEIRNLHFELCYYQGIEYAIRNRLRRFEAGAQGEHKIARGFNPQLTYSAHWIRHPVFREAIAKFIETEKSAIDQAFTELAPHQAFPS